ncbi:transporter substrate-binding domain-containing protein [Tissierella sp. MB52-C2]|uniref:transporter substrate-binding domain-containing protein n=1 Tax=Tissierella sp. MB52-C2 TaxID=3070999 RepID=UPI00280BE94B|nr:transporter substrate-binding domain-containing protein [Tissierella sp. MB52-C2]WMM25299.1 transporter substrate-binding domain-containing protein [Tissierella sp. MB52-C2]
MEKVRICADVKHPPYEFINDNGEIDGFNIDISKAIAKEMNIEIEVNLLDWTEAIKAMDNGHYDGIEGMSFSGDRQEKYIFGAEYITVFHSAFALENRQDIKDLINLYKYRVAVQKNDVGFEIITRASSNKNPISIFVVSSHEDALKLLLEGRVDLVVGNKLTILHYAEKQGFKNKLKLIGSPIHLTKYGIAFKKGNEAIANKFRMGMKKIKDNGKYEEIYDNWFNHKMGYFGKQIIENIDTGVIYIDKLGRITAVNKFAEGILALSLENILFKSFYETDIAKIFNTTVIHHILDGIEDTYYAKLEIDNACEKKYLEVNYTKLLDDKNVLVGVLINFIDITERKKIEETLIRKDKMESLGFLLLNIAHELRNPLTSVKNFIELIPEHIEDEEFRESLIYYVPKQVDYINKLFTSLLEYSKPNEANVSNVNIKELLENDIMKSLYKSSSRFKKIKFHIDIEERFTLNVDKNQIKQVLINLILNAIDGIKDIGNINVYAKEDNDKKMILIENDGKQISGANISKVFDPFFTTKKNGTGLGLFISYNLIKENNGIIEVENIDNIVRVSLIFQI